MYLVECNIVIMNVLHRMCYLY